MLHKTIKQLEKNVEGIINDGGEGVIIRKVNSKYDHGPNQSLYKLKVYNITDIVIINNIIRRIQMILKEWLSLLMMTIQSFSNCMTF